MARPCSNMLPPPDNRPTKRELIEDLKHAVFLMEFMSNVAPCDKTSGSLRTLEWVADDREIIDCIFCLLAKKGLAREIVKHD